MNPTEVSITHPKGRPWLHWIGKKPLERVKAYPAQLHDHFDPIGDGAPALPSPTFDQNDPWRNLLFYGDNKDVLAWLLANGYRGKVSLIYIDPPFDSGADYVRRVRLRGGKEKLGGEGYSLGEQVQYEDIWINDAYLQFMYERLLLLKELLMENGIIYLHCDWHQSHRLRCLLEEIFGQEGFMNEVIWRRTSAHSDTKGIGAIHDTIFVYSKGSSPFFNDKKLYAPYSKKYIESHYTQIDEDGRRYQLVDLTAPGPRPNLYYEFHGVWPPGGRVWMTLPEKMHALYEQGLIVFTSSGKPRRKQYLDKMPGKRLTDMWTRVYPVNSQALEATNFPTQKPEALLGRIIEISTGPNDLILDCFIGSGTTATVAQRLGRRWIGCDINKGATQTTAKRVAQIIEEQAEKLDLDPAPATTFSLYYVNNYDLQLRHQDAQELVAEHIGLERTRSNPFWDGTLDNEWVKIVPFSRPLTLLDVEEVKAEVENGPQRDVVIVALGAEPRARQAIDAYSKHLPRGSGRIRLVDLRTDERYGDFLIHEPAEPDVSVTREGTTVIVEIGDFISPTILKRLDIDAKGLGMHPEINDWRSMVDYVLIDPDYDGQVFNVRYADIPERKNDLVHGHYELPNVPAGSTVAVRIVDMLGEEVMPEPVTV